LSSTPHISKRYGIIGYPLSHSFSPGYFTKKFHDLGLSDHEYKAYPIQHILELEDVLKQGVVGFNVTIPYKQDVIDQLDSLDESASAVGAVNCVKVDNGKLIGYNTDALGFELSLLDQIGKDFRGKALILGTGGAALAVMYVLKKLGISYQIVSRKQHYLTYESLTDEIIASNHLIINTTPLGMYPKVDQCPEIRYNAITAKHFLYDLVYNPAVTLFLQKGQNKGASIKNGADMLVLQAEKSWEIWNQ
jgi:shikimate dehydrogenase